MRMSFYHVGIATALFVGVCQLPIDSKQGKTCQQSNQTTTGDSVSQKKQPSINPRPRVREIGLKVGVLPPGPLNTITDVSGVAVTPINHNT